MPRAPCLTATAAIDHFKSKETGDVSGGSTGVGREGMRELEKMLCLAWLLSKNEQECASNLSSVEFAALQSIAIINKVFKTHRL